MDFINFTDVEIDGGFWHSRQELNRTVTLKTIYDRFLQTGRFDAVKCNWQEGMPNKPHIFWDSDVAKWIEGSSYIIEKNPSPELCAIIDSLVEDIKGAMDDDGYFNCVYLTYKKGERWTNRWDHELYCAGHLIEAAIAYYNATGKRLFLDLMCRYADYIYKVFYIEHSAAFTSPGHEEIELALVRLYEATGIEKYLELGRYFIDVRGTEPKADEDELRAAKSMQSHIPVRQQKTAEGHAVRALYLYSAMADYSKLDGDSELLDSCKKIFDDIINHKMYITGGMGSTNIYEGFTLNYDLPNAKAYSESCAAIAMCMFTKRMLKIEPNSKYSDIFELVLYNGFLASTSLDGRSFFYENPLELQPKLHARNVSASLSAQEHEPIYERVEVFDCSCCPPNILRFVADLGGYIYGYDSDTLYIHQYIESHAEINGVSVRQKTEYPSASSVSISVNGAKKTAVRIPGWCKHFTITADGKPAEYQMKNGYAYIENASTIELSLDMPVRVMESNPAVCDCAGKIAVARGPVIYCAEAVDNGENLKALRIPKDSKFTLSYDDSLKTTVLETAAYKSIFDSSKLYDEVKSEAAVKMKLIPYYTFANRGASEMIVWLTAK